MAEATAEKPWSLREIARLAVLVVAAWLAWQVIGAFLAQRAAPALAVRVAGSSPLALTRAAEAELAAGRSGQAADLARMSLVRAPFNVAAMRVLALSLSEQGRDDAADEAMTLAGNWSLRDTPAHAWLVERRLRQGDYVSAFAHAETLLRRDQPVEEPVFQLLSTAGVQDGRGLASLERLLREGSPWRTRFIIWLQQRDGMDSLLATLAVALQDGPAPFTDMELEHLYQGWVGEGRIGALKMVRARIGRPDAGVLLAAPDFQGPAWPFGWRIESGVGRLAEVVPDDLGSGRTALRVEHDGRSYERIVNQVLLLDPGVYRLSGRRRVEYGEPRLEWRVRCMETGRIVSPDPDALPAARTAGEAPGAAWTTFSQVVAIPDAGCEAQQLELVPQTREVRGGAAEWFFGMAISPIG